MAVNRDFTKNYSLGGGELYIKLPNSDNFEYFGQTTDFKVNIKVDKIEHQNSEGDALVTDMEVVKQINGEVTISTEDFDKKILALAFGGEVQETTQNAGSVSDFEIKSAKGGKVYELGYVNVSDVVVTYKDSSGTTETAKEGVDYSVDYQFGRIEIAKGGTIDGEDISVSFSYAQTTVTDILTLNNISQEVALYFIQNLQVGQPKRVDIFKTKLLISGDFDVKSPEKFASLTLSGQILKDTSRPAGEQFLKITTLEG